MTDAVGPDFAAEMARLFSGSLPKTLGIAVSGGGDSIALVSLMAAWAAPLGVTLKAVTIDHGLREASAAEAVQAGQTCAKLGLSHDVILWGKWSGSGNLQDQARQARRQLIGRWARENSLGVVALGHTLDDQAETVLMRLARGSGVDGLSAMAAQSHQDGLTVIRPLLGQRRDALRAYLIRSNTPWVDDPSNEDRRFDRVKTRQALDHLEQLGLSQERLAETAQRMASTRRYLEHQTQLAARATVTLTSVGEVVLHRADFAALDFEVRHRLLAAVLKWVSSSPYRPRQAALVDVLQALGAGQAKTLAGCQITAEGENIVRIFREYQPVRDLRSSVQDLWDGRWQAVGPDQADDHYIAALGQGGLSQIPNWRDFNHPRSSLFSSPAIWHNDDVIATTFTKNTGLWRICLKKGPEQFYSGIITH